MADPRSQRLAALDGFRGLSILLVLAAHMLPLGPKAWKLNVASGQAGMALFFCLSGFLIVSQLHARRDVGSFFVRRAFRILPLATVVIVVVGVVFGAPAEHVVISLLYLQNLQTEAMLPHLGHFWSLCVEVQFYLFIGLFMGLTRFRAFGALLPLWIAMTAVRAWIAPGGSIQTHLSVDEILAGANLALVQQGRAPGWVAAGMRRMPIGLWIVLLIATTLEVPAWQPFHFLRGLAAAGLIGAVLVRPDVRWLAFLRSRPLRYLADISFALYVLHPLSMSGWLETGPTPIVKYAKRLVCMAIAFASAHASTFHFERRFQAWGKRLTTRVGGSSAPMPQAVIGGQPSKSD